MRAVQSVFGIGSTRTTLHGALAICLALALASVVTVLNGYTGLQSGDVGLVTITLVPFLLFALVRTFRYDLIAPATIFGLTWTSALAVAQFPLLPTFSWGPTMWLLVTLPPGLLLLGALVASGAAPLQRPQIDHRLFDPPRLTLVIAALTAVGCLGYGYYFAEIGTIPLFSGETDALRFSFFPLPALLAARGAPAAVLLGLIQIGVERRGRLWNVVIVAIASCAIFAGGGRLYLVAPVASAGIALYAIYGPRPRFIGMLAAGAAAVVLVSAMLFFYRLGEQAPTPFRSYVDEVLRSERPELLHWTIPVQFAAAGSLHTLSDLVDTDALQLDSDPGLYSMHAFDRLFKARDPEAIAFAVARFSQKTPTFLGPLYGDFGVLGAGIFCLFCGVVYGWLYRAGTSRRSPRWLVLYAYTGFWLVFFIYLNFWTHHGVWVPDIPLLVLGASAAARQAN